MNQSYAIEVANLLINLLSLLSLIGILIFFISSLVPACNQLYSRWQSLLFELAKDPKVNDKLRTEEYKKRGPDNESQKHYFIAVAILNLYEEAFHYQQTKVFYFFPLLPGDFWQSIEQSIGNNINSDKYLKTMWKARRDVYSDSFNQFLEGKIKNSNEDDQTVSNPTPLD